jgi:hypothetical protein
MTMNGEPNGILMEAIVAYFKVVSWNLLVEVKVSVSRTGDPSYASNDIATVLSCETGAKAENALKRITAYAATSMNKLQ